MSRLSAPPKRVIRITSLTGCRLVDTGHHVGTSGPALVTDNEHDGNGFGLLANSVIAMVAIIKKVGLFKHICISPPAGVNMDVSLSCLLLMASNGCVPQYPNLFKNKFSLANLDADIHKGNGEHFGGPVGGFANVQLSQGMCVAIWCRGGRAPPEEADEGPGFRLSVQSS